MGCLLRVGYLSRGCDGVPAERLWYLLRRWGTCGEGGEAVGHLLGREVVVSQAGREAGQRRRADDATELERAHRQAADERRTRLDETGRQTLETGLIHREEEEGEGRWAGQGHCQLSTPVNPRQPPSTPVNPRQPPSTPVNPRQPPSTPVNPRQPPSTPVNPRQPPSTPVNPRQPRQPCQSCQPCQLSTVTGGNKQSLVNIQSYIQLTTDNCDWLT